MSSYTSRTTSDSHLLPLRIRAGLMIAVSLLAVAVSLALMSCRPADSPRDEPSSVSSQVDTASADAAAVATIAAEMRRLVANPHIFSQELPVEYNYGLLVMEYCQSNLNAVRYDLLSHEGKAPSAIWECLEEQAGICGTQATVFVSVMKALGIRSRSVRVFRHDGSDNHAMAEVYYEGDWHLFDVTWGTIYRKETARPYDLLSWAEVEALGAEARPLAISNETAVSFRAYQETAKVDPLAYVGWGPESTDTLYDYRGAVHVQRKGESTAGALYAPVNQPVYIGSSTGSESVSYVLDPGDITEGHLLITGAVSGKGSLVVSGVEQPLSVAFEAGTMRSAAPGVRSIKFSGPFTLSIKRDPSSPVCYMQISQIELKTGEAPSGAGSAVVLQN